MSKAQRLNCGHHSTPRGVAAGYATFDGYTVCYGCATEWELADMARSATWGGYVNESSRIITTWAGGFLAKVTSLHYSRPRWAEAGEWRMRYVTARDDDGNIWRGQGSDAYDCITLRRAS